MMLYQMMYAPMIQKYTSGWPKYQKNMRVSITLMPGGHPKAHGIRRPISATTPRVATIHITKVAAAQKTTSGIGCPACVFRKKYTFSKISNATTQVPRTSSVAPI